MKNDLKLIVAVSCIAAGAMVVGILLAAYAISLFFGGK